MPDTPTETLAQTVRRMHRETGSADPRELAEKVLATLDTPAQVRDALAEALPDFVRNVVRTAHSGSLIALSRAVTPPAPTAGKGPGSSSARVGAVRAWYDRLLSQPVDVSGNRGEWKAMRECTREDLLTAAAYRRDVAARNVATADAMERLAAVLGDGQTVGDLAQATVTGALGRAA